MLLGLIPLRWYKGFPLVTEEYFGLDYAAWGKFVSEAWGSVGNYGGMTLMTFKFQGWVVQFLKSLISCIVADTSFFLSLLVES